MTLKKKKKVFPEPLNEIESSVRVFILSNRFNEGHPDQTPC